MSNVSIKYSSATRQLTESAVMVALATVLSIISIVKLPFGGSITLFSMLPIIIIAYRYSIGMGLFTGFVYGLIQMALDAKIFSVATSAKAAIVIVLLDYIVAFTVLGFAGCFKTLIKNKAVAVTCGTIFVCLLRYICHFITGCTVWAGVSIPDSQTILYSLSYNAAYMVPEMIITASVAYWLFKYVNFDGIEIIRMRSNKNNVKSTVLSAASLLLIIFTVLFDAILLFISINTEEGFNITLISNANFFVMGIVSAAAAVIAVVIRFISKYYDKNEQNNIK